MICAESAFAQVLCVLLSVYWIILLTRIILSWAMSLGWRPPYSGPLRTILDLIDAVTDPVLRPLRALMPPIRAGGVGLDLSPLIAFVILFVLRSVFC
ncbi:MAG TPA: YggT family protein [Actinomycetota bacterium]|jgi:YggT family protein|nr:YggT family protein [Actinomycetota bacterium]